MEVRYSKADLIDGRKQVYKCVNYCDGRKVSKGWWYPSLKPQHLIPFVDGKRHGLALWWENDGSLRNCIYYICGNVATKEEYRRYQLIEQLAGLK